MGWRRHFSGPANSQPLLVRSGESANLTIVMAIGAQPLPGLRFALVMLTGHFVSATWFYGVLIICAVCLMNMSCSRCCCFMKCCQKFLRTPLVVVYVALAYVCFWAVCVVRFGVLNAHTQAHWQPTLWFLDAGSGETQFTWDVPAMTTQAQRGTLELSFFSTFWYRTPTSSIPTPFGAGGVDGQGTIYLPHQDGIIYGISDKNNDGKIDPATEVSSVDGGACWDNPGAGLAPGLMAVGGIDGVVHIFTQPAQ